MEMEVSRTNGDAKTVYIGGLHADTTEPLLTALFAQFGIVKSCKIVPEGNSSADKYAFIEYAERKAAEMAISSMNGRVFLENKIKVNWATPPSATNGSGMSSGHDKSNHYPIFVGDISSEVTELELRNAFGKFGVITECRVVRDPVTSKCKNYAFISFREFAAAQSAIANMQGYWIGNRSIRTNWAHKKHFPVIAPPTSRKPTYQEVENQTGPTNTTIYCGNVSGLTDDFLKRTFSRFGPISRVRVFPEKGYGFVVFSDKPSAVRAIVAMNRVPVNGDVIRVSWGKERTSPMNAGYNVQAPSPAEAYYWQNLQSYPAAYNMFMQQQNFYQTNAALTNPYPFYSYAQPSPYGAEGGNVQNPQARQGHSTRPSLGNQATMESND